MTRGSFCAVVFSLSIFPLLTTHGSINKTKICASKECAAAAKNLKDSMDVTAKPCDDFYQYACKGWPKANKNPLHPLPASPASLRFVQNEKEILEYLKQNDDKNEPEAIHKARELYKTCMNRSSYDGINEMKQILSEIGIPYLAFKTPQNAKFDYVSAIAKTMRLAGIKMFFETSVEVNPYNHSKNAIWLTKPALQEYDFNAMPLINNHEVVKRAANAMDETLFLTKVVKKMCGADYPFFCRINDEELVANVLQLSLEQSKIILKARTKMNSSFIPKIYTLEEFQKLSDTIADEEKPSIPRLDWTRYMGIMFDGLVNVTLDLRNTSRVEIVVHEIDFFRDMIRFIYRRNIQEMELGLWWKVVSTLMPYANFNIFEAKTKFDHSIDRDRKCGKIVTSSFAMALGYMYMKNDRHNRTKTEIEEMFKHIKESFKKIFEQAPWMDQETKKKSLKKLAAMKSFIGYPNLNELSPILNEEYSNVKIGNKFLATMITKIQDQIKRNLNKLNEINIPTNTNWFMPSTVVNAFYVTLDNSILIPAALLGVPIHYKDNLKALTYGTIGSVVGHELTHGFDESGRKYNDKGELEEWWKNNTLVKFDRKSECFLKAYDNYDTSFEGFSQKVNSTITSAEDISDSGGFKEALYAYRSYMSENGKEPALVNFDTFTHEQLFTLGFANFWCESPTYFSPYLVPFMDHSPNAVRVNGVLKNSKEFSEIWSCPEGSNMNPVEKCSLW